MAALPTTIQPTRATAKKVNARILQANFGDGFTQRAGDGINTIKELWSVEYTCMDSTNSDELIDFLEARGGYENFTWTPPGETVEKKYVCKSWTINHSIGNSKKILNAEFEQVFDL